EHCFVCAAAPGQADGLLGVFEKVRWPAGSAEVTVRLPRGVPVTGRVVDGDTGRGIAQAEVQYRRREGHRTDEGLAGLVTHTDAQGQFRIVVPAGKGVLTATCWSGGYPEPAT